jgi:hypothetical protein
MRTKVEARPLQGRVRVASDRPWRGEGVSVEAWLHDARYLEIGVYDYDAPTDRKWTIAMIDRESAGKAVMSGEKKFATRDEAMREIGMTPPSAAD